MTEILDSDASVQFANIRKTLILSNVQPSDSGTYLAEVAIPIIGSFFSRARTSIDLVVFGEYTIAPESLCSTVYEHHVCKTVLYNSGG